MNTAARLGATEISNSYGWRYGGESVWGNGVSAPSGSGTGSGCSTFNVTNTAAPTWQTAQPNWQYTGCGTRRAIADVAADADPNTGAWVYTSAPNEYGQTGWLVEGGTSLSAPTT